MSMRERNKVDLSRGRTDSPVPPELMGVARLLERLAAHERGCIGREFEVRVAEGTGRRARLLDALGAAEGRSADEGLEARVFAASEPMLGGARLKLTEDAPAGLEDRVFAATRGVIAGAGEGRIASVGMGDGRVGTFEKSVRRADLPIARIGRWSARVAAVLALGGGVWFAWVAARGGGESSGGGAVVEPLAAATVEDDLSFDEFDEVLESHLSFMQTVEYEPADEDVSEMLGEDWCTSCELLAMEEEISS